MTMLYTEADADIQHLEGKIIGVIGYSTLGRSITRQFKQHQLIPIISADDTDEQAQAHQDGLTVASVAHCAKQADILILTLPNEKITRVYMNEIAPHIRKGQMLILISGYSIAFGFIEPPPFIDVALIAPRTTGDTFQNDKNAPSYVAVWQDSSRQAWDTVLAIASASGALKGGAMEITFEQEATLSLFIQQAILPAMYHLMTKAANLLINTGYPSDAVITDLYLSGKFSDFMQQSARHGLMNTLRSTNLTEQYATYSRLERFDELKLERLLEVSLEDIRSGKFAREWAQDYGDGHPRLDKYQAQQAKLNLWELEQQAVDILDDRDDKNI